MSVFCENILKSFELFPLAESSLVEANVLAATGREVHCVVVRVDLAA